MVARAALSIGKIVGAMNASSIAGEREARVDAGDKMKAQKVRLEKSP